MSHVLPLVLETLAPMRGLCIWNWKSTNACALHTPSLDFIGQGRTIERSTRGF
jgi:hypothetical protein